MHKNTASFLGLAKRAGKVASGEFSTEKAVKEGRAYLVLVAEDASDNTKKEFMDMCSFYETDILFCGTKEELGHAIGCEYRASLAVTDQGFADSLKRKLEAEGATATTV